MKIDAVKMFKNNRSLVMLINIHSRNLKLSSLLQFPFRNFCKSSVLQTPKFCFYYALERESMLCNYFYVTYVICMYLVYPLLKCGQCVNVCHIFLRTELGKLTFKITILQICVLILIYWFWVKNK